jgi:HK97 family phage prohead protease
MGFKNMDIKRTAPLLLKWADEGETGTFEGYGSTWTERPDSYGDIVQAGAFAASLKAHDEAGTAPAMLWSHNQDEPIGRFLEVREDAHGLYLKGQLELELQRGKEAHILAKNGVLGLSIGYLLRDFKRGPNGTTILTEIDLKEVSLVALPANSEAKITSVKSALANGDLRAFERSMRDALDLSAKQVKTLLAGGWKALYRDDAAPEMEALKSVLLSQGKQFETINTKR